VVAIISDTLARMTRLVIAGEKIRQKYINPNNYLNHSLQIYPPLSKIWSLRSILIVLNSYVVKLGSRLAYRQ